MSIDKTDQEILRNLMVDARLSARQLAIKLGMSTVTILTRIKKLEKQVDIIIVCAGGSHTENITRMLLA